MKGKIRHLEGITYDLRDAEQKKAHLRHYQRIYHRDWDEKNKDKIKQYNAKYFQSHKEQINEKRRELYETLTDEQKAKIKEYNRHYQYIRYNTDKEFAERQKQKVSDYYYRKCGYNV